jgi:transposase
LTKETLGKQEPKAQFVELRAGGFSYAKIATKLKVAKATLANWRSLPS